MTRRPSPQRLGARRGFTLVELLVALTGGLFVSLAVFTLARDANRFYQREGRLANATLAAVTGFERLRADIARAGFLATPNVQSDPLVCSRPDAGAGPLLFNLASVRVGTGANGSPSNATLTANGLQPDSLLLAGSYSSADEFPVRSVSASAAGAGYTVYLQVASGPMARLGWNAAATSTERTALLQTVFAAGRALRIVDNEGRQHYGLITQASLDPSGNPIIALAPTPALQLRQAQTRLCGLKGDETGATANVVNFVKYDLRNLSTDANYSELYKASTNDAIKKYEDDRTELVRQELDASQNNDTTVLSVNNVPQVELVAEYAVDFQIEVTTASADASDPVLQHVPKDASDGAFAAVTGLPSAGATPQRIRSMRVRLAVRSREPDRDANIAGGLYRIGLNAGGSGGGPYARVRALQADIMLTNNSNATSW